MRDEKDGKLGRKDVTRKLLGSVFGVVTAFPTILDSTLKSRVVIPTVLNVTV